MGGHATLSSTKVAIGAWHVAIYRVLLERTERERATQVLVMASSATAARRIVARANTAMDAVAHRPGRAWIARIFPGLLNSCTLEKGTQTRMTAATSAQRQRAHL